MDQPPDLGRRTGLGQADGVARKGPRRVPAATRWGGEYQLRRNSWFPAETKKIAFSEFRKHFGLKWKDDFDASILDFICRVLDVCAVAQVV